MVIIVSSHLRLGLLLHSFPVHHTTCPLYLVYPARKNWHDSHYRSIVGQTAESTMLLNTIMDYACRHMEMVDPNG